MLDDLLSATGIDRPLDEAALTRVLAAAVQRRTLRPVLVDLAAEGAPVDDELTAVQRLRDLAAADAVHVVDVLDRAGVRGARSLPLPVEDELLRLVRIRVPDERVATAAVRALEADGMRRWGPTGEGAWRAYRRSHGSVTLTCLDERPTRAEVVWHTRADTVTGWRRVLRTAFVPTQADFDTVALPGPLWPLYSVLRPLRLVLARLGWRRGRTPGDDLGPYLSTPIGLTSAFVDQAGLAGDDLVVDLGCGDGRLLVDAVRRTGCRGRGVERDPSLVEVARRNVRGAGLDDRIDIVHADAATAPLDDATVVLLFLPSQVVAQLIGPLLGRLRPGARVLAHEQVELVADPAPARSVPLITDAGVTVVHTWHA